jgi:hypothetical protein
MPALHAIPVITQLQKEAERFPFSGWAQYRKPARPPTAASEPSHSRDPTVKPNQMESTATRKTNSSVKMGCTCESRPKCRATAWRMKETIISANPRSQTPRRTAYVIKLSFSAFSAGASSTPIRWNTLVSALARDAPSAKIKTIEIRFRPRYMYYAGI